MQSTTVAIIGLGRFGQLAIQILAKKNAYLDPKKKITILLISSKKNLPKPIKEIILSDEQIMYSHMSELKQADIIIPCVPIRFFEKCIQEIAPLCRSGAIVIDVCSVKLYPIKVMKKHLLKHTHIIATHPMFGPDSFAKNNHQTKGLKLIIDNIRCPQSKYQLIKTFLESIPLKVIEMSADDHDRYAAYSMTYFSLIGKIGNQLKIKSTPIDTPWFEKLLALQQVVANDSDQLFWDMQQYNPYAYQLRQKIASQLQKIENTLQ